MAALFILFLRLLVACYANEDKPPYPQHRSQMYELNKQRLREFWHMAALKGLVKAKARAAFPEIPRIEQVIYNQCESSAKTVVALSKCAVRVFDSRDPALVELQKKKSFIELQAVKAKVTRPIFKTNFVTRRRPYKNFHYRTNATQKEIPKTSYFYSKDHGWVKDPIRPQKRPRRDAIDAAWDMFLEEERRKKKNEIKRRNPAGVRIKLRRIEENKSKTITIGETNFMGLHRVMNRAPRFKREIKISEPAEAQNYALNFLGKLYKHFNHYVDAKTNFPHLENLRRINDYFQKSKKVQEYFKLINTENQKLFSTLPYPLDSKEPEMDNEAANVLESVINMINKFSGQEFSKFSVLSPRLFSLFPEMDGSRKHFLSPAMLSFDDHGFFSLPDILKVLSSNQQAQQRMLELLMDLSEAGNALQTAVDRLAPKMEEMDNLHYPLLLEMSHHDYNWMQARKTFTPDQKSQMDRHGYAVLNDDQMKLVYGSKRFMTAPGNVSSLYGLSDEEKELRVEGIIRDIANVGKPKWPFWGDRIKRHAVSAEAAGSHGETAAGKHAEHAEHHWFVNLSPVAFTNFVNHGIALEALTLSPRAFVGEIMAPEALIAQTLSPRAFIASVLAPSALVARILSPTALRAEVLSPRALNVWVLSPEAMIAEVLTPHFLEPRILSPESMVIFVLSPQFLSPHVLSGESLGVVILSPNILSPRIASEEKMLVEVLSPHILGGPHSEEEAKTDVISIGGLGHAEHEHAPEAHGLPGNSNAEEHDHPADFLDALHKGGSSGSHGHDSHSHGKSEHGFHDPFGLIHIIP